MDLKKVSNRKDSHFKHLNQTQSYGYNMSGECDTNLKVTQGVNLQISVFEGVKI